MLATNKTQRNSDSDSTVSDSTPSPSFRSIDCYPQRAGRIIRVDTRTGNIFITADTLPIYRRASTLTDKYICHNTHVFNKECLHSYTKLEDIRLNTALTYAPLSTAHIKRYCNSRLQLTRPQQECLSIFTSMLFKQLGIKQLELFIAFTVLFTRFQLAETQPPITPLYDACFISAIIAQENYQATERNCEPEFDYQALNFPTQQYDRSLTLTLKTYTKRLKKHFLQSINSHVHISQTEFSQYHDFFKTSNRRPPQHSNQRLRAPTVKP